MGAFHDGELALQVRAGVRERLGDGPFIRDHMPQQHCDFFALLPFVLAGSIAADGQPWASVLTGPVGFVQSPDPRLLSVRAQPAAHDPLSANLQAGAALGLLGIQPHTRRRNRLNGHVAAADASGFLVSVDQSFGNCPKYIQAREATYTGPASAPAATRLERLDDAAVQLVRSADTFFIATAHPQARSSASREQGVDVSHRGGKPGFVRVDDGVLTVPDFTGNSFFNTLGNLVLEPRCGLLFLDFEQGGTLQVAARAEIVTEGAELASFRGALRLLRLHVTSAIRAEQALPLRWTKAELSPVLADTGHW
ncbi:pyridoxamine 5'-phosphate oxidase family protein [Ramlibacter sp. PS4R-6]|uniref:pyridoxamine 5'-phosphate oxidase family protein n=1 Tax=Ramlibacter sp. PS4R-6 TaxID=3133438 RepID=UPI0030A429DD